MGLCDLDDDFAVGEMAGKLDRIAHAESNRQSLQLRAFTSISDHNEPGLGHIPAECGKGLDYYVNFFSLDEAGRGRDRE